LDSYFALILYVLELFGTGAFAFTGSLAAIRHKYDLIGIIILAILTGNAGGTLRDMIVGISPPSTLSNPAYIVLSIVVALFVFLVFKSLGNKEKIFVIFDGIGLGVFTVTGASVAYALMGPNLLIIVVCSSLTSIAGGIIRDIAVNEMPLVFTREIYGLANFIGAVLYWFLVYLHVDQALVTTLCIILVTMFRLISYALNWHLPTAKNK
jgi:uncharacterized membrane protein YeiH